MKINRIIQLIAATAFVANVSSTAFAAGQHAQGRYQPNVSQASVSVTESGDRNYRQYSQTVQHNKTVSNTVPRTAAVQTVVIEAGEPTKVLRQQSEAVQHQKSVKSKTVKPVMAQSPLAEIKTSSADLLDQIDALFDDLARTI